ncbi:MAG: NTP transferase domain-containing protein [Candidatus Omnitrophica bacterium]|nr:NTP transferase domain-containing protein [Candidatus Omnitrophota bacterium]
MKTLGIIPARKGSQRFPSKHQALLLGKPMFAYVLEAAKEARRLDRIVVSSDDLSLRPLAEQYGIEFIERPAEMASLTAPLEDALRHACRWVEKREGETLEMVVTLLGNVPVRKPGRVDETIQRLTELPEATSVCTALKIRRRPEWSKRMEEGTGRAVPFLPGQTAYRAQDYPDLFQIDGAVQAVRRQVLFAQAGNSNAHHWLGDHIDLLVQEHPRYSLEVDYPDQGALAEFYLLYERYGSRWLEQLHVPAS